MDRQIALGQAALASSGELCWNLRALLRLVGLASGAGLVLAALGPFGTYADIGWLDRLFLWELIMLGAAAAHIPALWLLDLIAERVGAPPIILILGSAVLAAMPTTLLVTGLIAVLYGLTEPPSFASMFGYVVTISIPMQGLSYVLLRVVQPAAQPVIFETNNEKPVLPVTDNLETFQPPRHTPLLDRLPRHIGRDVQCLEMHDHYVRVTTSLGSALILARMGDAVDQLVGTEGARVHRSWWVAQSAIVAVKKQGRSVELVLANGLSVPVSRDRQSALRSAGWLDNQNQHTVG